MNGLLTFKVQRPHICGHRYLFTAVRCSHICGHSPDRRIDYFTKSLRISLHKNIMIMYSICILFFVFNIVEAFGEMHVLPAKHSSAWLPRKPDYRTDTRTDGQTDTGQSDPYVQLCFAGDTKRSTLYKILHLVRISINGIWCFLSTHSSDFENGGTQQSESWPSYFI